MARDYQPVKAMYETKEEGESELNQITIKSPLEQIKEATKPWYDKYKEKITSNWFKYLVSIVAMGLIIAVTVAIEYNSKQFQNLQDKDNELEEKIQESLPCFSDQKDLETKLTELQFANSKLKEQLANLTTDYLVLATKLQEYTASTTNTLSSQQASIKELHSMHENLTHEVRHDRSFIETVAQNVSDIHEQLAELTSTTVNKGPDSDFISRIDLLETKLEAASKKLDTITSKLEAEEETMAKEFEARITTLEKYVQSHTVSDMTLFFIACAIICIVLVVSLCIAPCVKGCRNNS